ncbi:MAG: hypothetical protein V7645_877, partial [Actinomycetota bacterium]
MTSLRSNPVRHRLATAARILGGAFVFAAGLLLAGAFTSSAPAAPQDCLPVVGCVTTTPPTVPLPGVTLPTLPTVPVTTTTTTQGGSTASSTTSTANSVTTATGSTTVSEGATAFSPKATVRVRGRGARRVVEIRVNLTKAARLNALLSRKRGPVVKRLFIAKTGPHLFKLRIGRAAKPGLASL